MRVRIASPKELVAGLLYVAFAAAVLWIGADYGMGTAGRMGPGYFPKVLAGMLIVVGVISIVRSLLLEGEAISAVPWRALVLVLAAVCVFGLALPRLGMMAALIALCLVSAAASRHFRPDPMALIGLLGLVVLCAAVFVKGLGVPMPLWGSWLEPYVAPLPPWMR